MKKIFILIVIAITIFSSYGFFNNKVRHDFGRDIKYFVNLIRQPNSNLPTSLNLIILGLDPRNDSLEKTEVTDTILFANYNSQTAQLNLFPLPRDLWSYHNNSKINQIYPLSKQTSDHYQFIANSFNQLLNQKVDRVVIITTNSLVELIKIIDGVDLTLDKGFVDYKYPNPDYISNPKSNLPVYKTVGFPAGLVHIDSTNVTEFVRSRKSSETAEDGGTDLGRIKRQELLIDAIITKLKKPEVILDYNRLVKLYNFWQEHIETNFTDPDLISIIKNNRVNFKKFKIVKNDITHLLYHPTNFINPQWVFLPINNDYQQLQDFIKAKI